MTSEEKREFVESLLSGFKDDILRKVDKMPERWAGKEIRQYIADKAQEQIVCDCYGMSRSEKREFNNDVIINNL